MSWLAKFREAAASLGWRNAVLLALSRTLFALFGERVRIVKYHITAQPVAAATSGRDARLGAFDLHFVDASSPLLQQVARPPEVIAARFAQGARCLVAARDGTLAGFLWFVTGPYEEDEVRVRFVPLPAGQAAWDFDVTVMPAYRMSRVFSYLWARASSELAAAGIRHTVSRISAFNAASLAAHRRLGARCVATASFLCVGPWQLMRSSVAPRWQLSRHRGARPTLAITAD